MRNASSASATWRDRASASEYTATVAMPMRRAVLVTRQAISPRLAIRIWGKTGRTLFLLLGALFHRLPQPCGLALLEKGAHAFLALRGGPGGGDASGHVVHQSGIDPPPRDRTDQVLGHRVRPGRTLDELAQDRVDRRVQLRGLRQLLNEADAVRLRRRKTLGGEEIAPRGALGDHRVVEGVAQVGPVEPKDGNAQARMDFDGFVPHASSPETLVQIASAAR